jgi:SOUL heme-binding protein
MGSIFGKETVAEPAFTVLMKRSGSHVHTPYEIRHYGQRFAATVHYNSTGETSDMGEPFRALARYIGVFGTPENDGKQVISMTAPVVTEKEGTKLAMTAPVVTENSDKGGEKVMKFMLPAEYDEMSKIPNPTNQQVKIEEIPPQVGVVHRYSGRWTETSNRGIAAELASQLTADGLDRMDVDYALDHFQFWGYNPPFTIPMFRRNEIWMELNDEEVQYLVSKFDPSTAN